VTPANRAAPARGDEIRPSGQIDPVPLLIAHLRTVRETTDAVIMIAEGRRGRCSPREFMRTTPTAMSTPMREMSMEGSSTPPLRLVHVTTVPATLMFLTGQARYLRRRGKEAL
jgi:hypothetical protein